MRTSMILLLGFGLFSSSAFSQNHVTYKQPPTEVASAILAPPPPIAVSSPTHEAILFVEYNANPSIALLARPYARLAGLRIDTALNCRQITVEYTGLWIRWLWQEAPVRVNLPAHGSLAGIPQWSPDGRQIAFGIQGSMGIELWVANAWTGECHRAANMMLNDVLGPAFQWMKDSDRLLVKVVPAYREPVPKPSPIPSGPIVEETTPGKLAQVRTHQDLLQNADDERLFEYYATSQIAVVRSSTAQVHQLCLPDLYVEAEWSPNEQYLLVTALQKPFSYRVPYSDFSRRTEVRDARGQLIRELDNRPVSDNTPRQGVVTGPRGFRWQALYPARLLWTEALDGGDPTQPAEYRDALYRLDAPFSDTPVALLKTRHRLTRLDWTAEPDVVLLTEYDRNRRWTTTYRLHLEQPSEKKVLFDRSIRDDYTDPGTPLYARLPNGHYVLRQDGDWAWFSARGASPKGDYPRLDKISLKTGERKTIYACPENAFEEFIMFEGKNTQRIVTRYQSKTEVPNFYLIDLKTKSRKALTAFVDPAPHLTRVEKRLLRYQRADGVPLSGILYLPPDYQPGQRLPLFIWAYPLEYSDPNTAGQVRGSEHTFSYFRNDSPLFLLTQGHAVLMNATMPIVGDPETMNNTFVEQVVASGRAAIDYLDSIGIIDRGRVGVGGHSYGAFMTATLLAHSDDYAYGIARSGAYNRTLTPFGFQSERRSFWEAPDVYMRVSPFTYAHRINEPLLLIHGQADNNSGTFPMQSERLFQAINGHGGTARLVLLPHESHSYRARESVLHVVAEMLEWAERYGKKGGGAP